MHARRVVIIGAGMGGLAAALRLAHMGFQVVVLEQGPRPGGRSNLIEAAGFRVDTGPTILVMKDAFEETYRAVGEDLATRIEFERLDPNYRLYFHDGEVLDLPSSRRRLTAEVERIEEGAGEGLARFLEDGALKYELGMDFVTRNYRRLTDLANPGAALRLLKTRAYQNLYAQVGRYFQSDKLRKAFTFHSMFLGLSPFEAPAMYSLITYADLGLGMWYPHGGIYRLVEDLAALARERGVEFHFNQPVREIVVRDRRAVGVRTAGGHWPADIVISNADLPYTYRQLLPEEARPSYPDRRLRAMDYACSGYLLYLGLDRQYPHLAHQSLYFSEDYRANLTDIFQGMRLPADPSFHLSVPSVTDPSVAPAGHTLLYTLAPMPNLGAGLDWDRAGPQVEEQLLTKLERLIDPDLRRHIVWRQSFRPTDFQSKYNAVRGTAFGSLSHGFLQSSYFRPHNKAPDLDGMYFVGQGTYPGIGLPMVQISARLVAERIEEEWS